MYECVCVCVFVRICLRIYANVRVHIGCVCACADVYVCKNVCVYAIIMRVCINTDEMNTCQLDTCMKISKCYVAIMQ